MSIYRQIYWLNFKWVNFYLDIFFLPKLELDSLDYIIIYPKVQKQCILILTGKMKHILPWILSFNNAAILLNFFLSFCFIHLHSSVWPKLIKLVPKMFGKAFLLAGCPHHTLSLYTVCLMSLKCTSSQSAVWLCQCQSLLLFWVLYFCREPTSEQAWPHSCVLTLWCLCLCLPFQFAWTHVTLLIVVTQSHLVIQNLFEGKIW